MRKYKESSCGCDACREACQQRACWTTPEEARKLIAAGYLKRLMIDWWVAGTDILVVCPAERGREENRASESPGGCCTFYSDEKGCELHSKGLKPVEGRATSCKRSQPRLHEQVAMTWKNKKAQAFAKEIESQFMGWDEST